MKMYNYDELKDSKLMYDKNPPALMPVMILIISFLIGILVFMSFNFKKTYIVKGHGSIESDSKQYIMCSVGGEIVDCQIKEGCFVKKDNVILKIKSPEIKVKKQELSEQLNILQLREEKLRRLEDSISQNVNLFDKNIDSEIEFYNKYEAIFAELKEFSLDESFLKNHFQSEDEVSEYLNNSKNKKDQLKTKYLSETSSEISKVDLEKQNLNIQIDAINIEENEFLIKAPQDGIVHLVFPVSNSMVLNAGQTIATVLNNENLHVDAFISSQDRAKVDVGQDVKISVLGFSKSEYGFLKGKIQNIDTDATIDEKTGNVLFKLSVKPDESILVNKKGKGISVVPGMVAEINVCYNESSYFDYFREKFGL